MDKNVLKNLSYGVYIIGCKGAKNAGCVVNTVVQITNDPMTIALSINHNNYTNEVIKKTNKFSISILSEDTKSEIIGTFGYKSSKDINKYANIDWEEISDVPIIKDTCGNIICEVIKTVETSTHTIFIAQIKQMLNFSNKVPMTYRYYQEVLKGKSPKNAPTFINEEEINNKTTKWKCSICGYEVEMDELPKDYRCPICGQPVEVFKKI